MAVDLVAALGVPGIAEQPLMVGEHALVALAELAQELRRALEVGEEHGDGAAWKLDLAAGEALREQNGKVVRQQVGELVRAGEPLVGNTGSVLDPTKEPVESLIAVRCRIPNVEKGRLPFREEILVLQTGDVHVRRNPTVRIAVDPDEDVRLLKVGAVQLLRRVWTGAQLEHYRRQVQSLDRFPRRQPLLGQLAHRRADEDAQPLVRCTDAARADRMVSHHPAGS